MITIEFIVILQPADRHAFWRMGLGLDKRYRSVYFDVYLWSAAWVNRRLM